MNDDVAIKVHNVSKSFKLPHEKHGSIKSLFVSGFRGKRTYEKQEVLKNVSFDVKKGEFFGIVGRNGSGKSTLLKLMAGIYTPNKGNIQVNGKLTPFIELGVGFNPNLTGRENVFLNGALLGFSRQEMEVMYDEIVEFAELKRFMDQKLKNYSSGMQVRLAFSIAAKVDSPILILDEVLAVGDANFQEKCFSYFEMLKQKKRTVILVSHSMDQIKRFCTQAAYIKDGEVLKIGTASEVADTYTVDVFMNKKKQGLSNNKNKLKIDIEKSTSDYIKLRMLYEVEKNTNAYIGMSVLTRGASVAEITTDPNKPLKDQGFVSYTLGKDFLNPGVYSVGAALFNLENKEQIAGTGLEGRQRIVVEGNDKRRGAALKLKDSWQYE